MGVYRYRFRLITNSHIRYSFEVSNPHIVGQCSGILLTADLLLTAGLLLPAGLLLSAGLLLPAGLIAQSLNESCSLYSYKQKLYTLIYYIAL